MTLYLLLLGIVILICILWTLYNKQSLISLIPYLFNGSSEDFIPYWSWYLYAMISLYLMTPFLQKMLKNFNNKDYFVFIGLFLFLPSFLKFVSAILPVLFAVFFRFIYHFLRQKNILPKNLFCHIHRGFCITHIKICLYHFCIIGGKYRTAHHNLTAKPCLF